MKKLLFVIVCNQLLLLQGCCDCTDKRCFEGVFFYLYNAESRDETLPYGEYKLLWQTETGNGEVVEEISEPKHGRTTEVVLLVEFFSTEEFENSVPSDSPIEYEIYIDNELMFAGSSPVEKTTSVCNECSGPCSDDMATSASVEVELELLTY